MKFFENKNTIITHLVTKASYLIGRVFIDPEDKNWQTDNYLNFGVLLTLHLKKKSIIIKDNVDMNNC
jgi:hypothetical protein